MNINKNAEKYLKIFLILISLHSLSIGISFIFFPIDYFELFGYNKINERFFVFQGGAFHIVMAIGYLIAAYINSEKKVFLIFIITVKFLATFFLFTYFIFNQIWIVLISGFSDFIMAIIIYYFYKLIYKK